LIGICKKSGDKMSLSRTHPKVTNMKMPTVKVAGENPIRNGAAALFAWCAKACQQHGSYGY